jgi:hypothetical protein
MMKKISTLVISSLGLVALASGCAVDAVESEELLGTEEQEAQVCSNDQATNAIAASMAVVMAREVGRWDPRQDLTKTSIQICYSWGCQWTDIVALTQAAKNRCTSRGYVINNVPCGKLQGLLDLQVYGAGAQFGGASLTDAGVLRNRLVSYYNDQKNCIDDTARNGDGQAQNCPAESNELAKYKDTMSGSTCAGSKDFWYKATYAAGHAMAGQPLSGPDSQQLKNNLKWAGGVQNPYLAYEADPNVAGDVKVDPLDGTTGDGSSGSGSCEVAANPVWNGTRNVCDITNDSKVMYSCCTCGGQQRSWKQAVGQPVGWFACRL